MLVSMVDNQVFMAMSLPLRVLSVYSKNRRKSRDDSENSISEVDMHQRSLNQSDSLAFWLPVFLSSQETERWS